MNPLAEARATTLSSLQAGSLCVFVYCDSPFPFVSPFSLFNTTGQSSKVFGFFSGHGMLSRLDGKSNLWEHNFALVTLGIG
jgi:hypothetical protein